jgi:hypothetical protein
LHHWAIVHPPTSAEILLSTLISFSNKNRWTGLAKKRTAQAGTKQQHAIVMGLRGRRSSTDDPYRALCAFRIRSEKRFFS